MSATATAYVWNRSPYKGVAFTIHLAIADVANDMHGNRVWASASTLAEKARTTRETVTRTLATMVEDGFVRIEGDDLDLRRSRHQGREFTFLMPETDVTSDHIELGQAEVIRCDEASHRDVTSDHIHDVTSDHIQGTKEGTEEGTEEGNPPTPLAGGDGSPSGLELVPSAPASLEPVPNEKPKTLAAICDEVLGAWVEATGRSAARSRINDARRKKVKARLAEGYSVQELLAAVRGIALSEWHMGNNPGQKRYDDMELALRNGPNLEKFRDLYESGGDSGGQTGADQALAELQRLGLA